MFSKIRSLIFKLDPELAHTLAIKALKFNYNPTKISQKIVLLKQPFLVKKFLILLV